MGTFSLFMNTTSAGDQDRTLYVSFIESCQPIVIQVLAHISVRKRVNPLGARVGLLVLIPRTPEGNARQDNEVMEIMFHEERAYNKKS